MTYIHWHTTIAKGKVGAICWRFAVQLQSIMDMKSRVRGKDSIDDSITLKIEDVKRIQINLLQFPHTFGFHLNEYDHMLISHKFTKSQRIASLIIVFSNIWLCIIFGKYLNKQ